MNAKTLRHDEVNDATREMQKSMPKSLLPFLRQEEAPSLSSARPTEIV